MQLLQIDNIPIVYKMIKWYCIYSLCCYISNQKKNIHNNKIILEVNFIWHIAQRDKKNTMQIVRF